MSEGDSIVEIEFQEAKKSPKSTESKTSNTDESKAVEKFEMPKVMDMRMHFAILGKRSLQLQEPSSELDLLQLDEPNAACSAISFEL